VIEEDRVSGSRALFVTDDVDLLDDLLRVAAAAHLESEVASSATAAATRWSAADLVLVGVDLADQVSAAGLPTRPELLLVTRGGRSDPWVAATAIGADRVVDLPAAELWLVDRFARVTVANRPRGLIVGVIGARGGAGATTLTAALATVAGDRGVTGGAVDLDQFGAGLEHAMGGSGSGGPTWADLDRTRGRIPPGLLHARLPRVNGSAMVTWGDGPRRWPSAGVPAAVLDSLRHSVELVLVDLPGHLLTSCTEVTSRLDRLLLVVPREVGSVLAGANVLGRPELAGLDVRLVVRGPAPGGLSASRVVEALGRPMVVDMRADPMLARDTELGLAPGLRRRQPLGRACRAILRDLGLTGDSS